ncbi:MAG TPA: twin-arginine translocase subunit TatC [Dermatophilaceae bacterium]|nr:twin-arginine translocase subunit TatC [Dermatophilaceae bacterium]
MLSRLFGLYRGKPQNPVGDDGRMALADHFRELRARLLRAITVLIVAIIVALVFYDQIFEFVTSPYRDALAVQNPDVKSRLISSDIGGPLMLQLKLCTFAAIGATSPYWLWQIWAFILPGLSPRERKWSWLFIAVAGPLFLAGMALGFYVMPKGLAVLIAFTQTQVENLVDVGRLIGFMTQMLLVFGLAFEIPLFVVMLNLVGVLPGRVLVRYRPWIVLGTFVFAAVATPSTDPISMCFLAVPMLVLFGISEVITRAIDRIRARRAEAQGIPLDEASPL